METFQCMRFARDPKTAEMLMYVYAMLVSLLLLNMIIAMMGKTFDRHWSNAQATPYPFDPA